MTIKRKNVGISGVIEAEADPTDTVDLLGFSTPIQSVGGKTAQFSDTSLMKANVGLRIGLLQVVINTDGLNPPAITEIVAPNVNTFDVGTNGWSGQFTDQDTAASITLTEFNDNESERIYDLGDSTNKTIDVTTSVDNTDQIFSITNGVQGFGSNDCALTDLTISSNYSRVWDVDESDDVTFTVGVTNILNNVPTASLNNIPTTKRYLRFTEIVDVDFSTTSQGSGNQNNCTVNNCGTPGGCCVFGCGGMTKTSRNIPNTIFTSIINTDLDTEVTVRVRSSVTQDGTDGSVLIPDQIMNANETLTFDDELYLTGNNQYVTLEIVDGNQVPTSLSDITSIREE